MTSPFPPDELARLGALREYEILDTDPDPDFDAITALAARICKVPVSILGFIDSERHWFKSAVGVGGIRQSPREASFCGHAILEPGKMLVIPDVLNDRRFADNPIVAAPPHVRFYAGMPLVSADDHALGTLCIIDVVPRTFDEEQCETLVHLGRQAQTLLEYRRTISRLRFFESAIANTQDSVLIYKAADSHEAGSVRPVYVNAAFRRVTGYGLTEVQDSSRGFSESASDRHAIDAELLRATASGRASSYELVKRRKDGQSSVTDVSVSPVTDLAGRTTHWVSIERDVTDRREAEAALIRAYTAEAANTTLTQEIAQRKRAELSLLHAASHDELTGLPNRAYFLDRLQERLDRTRRTGRTDSPSYLSIWIGSSASTIAWAISWGIASCARSRSACVIRYARATS